VFSGFPHPEGDPLPAGADAYVLKGRHLDDLLDTVARCRVEAAARDAASPVDPPPPLPTTETHRLPDSRIDVISHPDHLGIAVHGDLDVQSGRELLALLLPAIEGGRRVRLDLAKVSFVDAYGVRCIGLADQRASEVGGRFEVTAASPAVRRLVDLSGLREVLAAREG
jgi:anti-anti-sigma factor